MSFSNYHNEKIINLPVHGEREFKWYGDVLEIDFTEMYSSPVEMSYAFLRSMVEYFGTEEIDTNDVNRSGCDTCDWGSAYGFILCVHNPTKNIPEKPKETKRNL